MFGAVQGSAFSEMTGQKWKSDDDDDVVNEMYSLELLDRKVARLVTEIHFAAAKEEASRSHPYFHTLKLIHCSSNLIECQGINS